MDLHPTPFKVGKPENPRSITNQKDSESQRANNPKAKSTTGRQRRAFGTIRDPNVPPGRPGTAKSIKQPIKSSSSSGAARKPKKSSQSTANPAPIAGVSVTALSEAAQKTPPEGNTVRPKKKKSVSFGEKSSDEIIEQSDKVGDVRTPVKSPTLIKPAVSGTPYHSAARCSKCRYDQLQTSSYWLTQIRLAESVGKDFVSAAFFQLALESKAEPSRNIRVELKRYLERHGHLLSEKKWRDVSSSFGLIKDDSTNDQEVEKGKTEEAGQDHGEEQTVEDQVAEEPGETVDS